MVGRFVPVLRDLQCTSSFRSSKMSVRSMEAAGWSETVHPHAGGEHRDAYQPSKPFQSFQVKPFQDSKTPLPERC